MQQVVTILPKPDLSDSAGAVSWHWCQNHGEALDAIAFWSRHAMFPFAFCFCLVLFGVWVVGVCFLLCLCWFFVLELAPLCSDFAPLLNPQRGIQ